VLTESVVRNFCNEDQTNTVHDPNVTYWVTAGARGARAEGSGVRRGFNLCVAPSQDAVSYFGGRGNVRAFGRVKRDEGKT
jgi:hypothetical protein